MFANRVAMILGFVALLLPRQADGTPKADTGSQAERALHAANVIRELMNTPESNIPPELLERAKAIAVIPNLIKAAMGVGGMHGKGLVTGRTPSGWGAPAFIDLTGGSFGFQIGVSATDLVLIFTKEDGLKGLLEDKLELGGEAGVAAGPVGRAAEGGTNLTFDSPIYSYSRSKGLFAGIALKGAVMSIDDSANHKVYGNNVSGTDILLRNTVRPSAEVKPFLQALQATKVARKAETRETTVTRAEDAKVAAPNENIKKAQDALRNNGYDPGPTDGALGPRTKTALRQFQQAENMPVTGRLDVDTASKLGVEPESVGGNFKGAGREVKEGGQEAGHEIKEGKPVAAGKELGKGVGRAGKKVGKGVKEAVDPESDHQKREEENKEK